MYIYAVRTSYSLCVTRKDWVPLQMLEHGATPVMAFNDGPFCLVRFDWVE